MALGSRLRRLRENRNLSVKDLAQAIGVSRSFIYQLERDEVSPSYSTLRGIAATLGTTVAVLVDDMVPEEWLVVRREGRKRLVIPGSGADDRPAGGDRAGAQSRFELMAFLGSRNRRMQPVVLELGPGASTSDFPFDHQREDLFYVTGGEVRLSVEGGRQIDLKAGDAAYLLFEELTAIENPGRETATCLWVVAPPG